MVAELEASLGSRLLSRTTRNVVPTEAGLEFLARIEPILAAIEDAENSVRETGELRGLLRVGMPATMGMRVIMPRLSAFTERHPLLRIELLLDATWRDLTREAVDVSIRVGDLPDASGTRKLIGTMRRVLVAGAAYVARHGAPDQPVDLTTPHIVVGPVGPNSRSWMFERNGETAAVEVQPHISVNDTAGALAAAVCNLGITPTTSWACRRELQSGELVQVLHDWQLGELPVYAYFPMGRTTRMAAREFIDFIAGQLHGESSMPR
jgi:DNA-binding transcriptional LysR family regulator